MALVAVTKTFDEEAILPVLEQGHVDFGENRVQEALRKWPPLMARFPNVKVHLIGPLQTNKVQDAVSFFDCIQTVDRPKLAAAMASEMAAQARLPRLFVQVNIGGEAQKAGIALDDAHGFVERCRDQNALPISGLMCIPPAEADPRPHFERLGALARGLGLTNLSMGMSGDFEDAIRAGSTMVRVGSAIFGHR